MPRPQDIAPTYDQTIEKIMRDASGPMSAQELAEKILAARPSNAKDPMKTARNKLREAIEPPQPDAEYPREATRNAPKYADCVECQKKGERNTAVSICFSCTKSPNEERLLCEKCAEKHEDHYVEKILY